MDSIVPRNFSWLEDGKIAALAFPEKREDLEYLVSVGIRYLVTLTKELKPHVEEVSGLTGVDISVEDFCTFTIEQVQQFVQVCEKASLENVVRSPFCNEPFKILHFVYCINLKISNAILTLHYFLL